MKAYISPYPSYASCNNLLNWLEDRKWISEKTSEKISDSINPVFKIWNSRPWNKQKVKIRIDDHDVWGMHKTLALIIHPMLLRLTENKQGSPYVDDSDVPENIRSDKAPPKKNDWDVDDNHFIRWEWVMGEMIWTFEQLSRDLEDEEKFWLVKPIIDFDSPEDDSGVTTLQWKQEGKLDKVGRDEYLKRIDNGTRLFGKYFQSLWD